MTLGERDIEVCVLEGDADMIAQVKEETGEHSWVHFACHGVQKIIEPLNSGFHLHDGLLQLRLHDIMLLNLARAGHAFLSACQTSTGDGRLRDEVVHLAARMLAVGYRGVVATMWSMQDQYGPEIASNFYSHLLDNAELTTNGGPSAHQLSASGAARALDFGMQKLREKLGGGRELFWRRCTMFTLKFDLDFALPWKLLKDRPNGASITTE
ncbi:unnamed protein product [Cyclocybe aegerita]|uniref:CHAT domain-containing protein n=1 Tax=Cyclocybe aegerita TaxID=1973307 RepID=A0A8S0WVT9_CYCAE|nr:unnamed protein product [Cyclocybe aegerita]